MVTEGLAQLRVQELRRGPADPLPGVARDGVDPGQWMPDELGLPPDCPVRPLGMDGDLVYFIDANGQLQSTSPSAFGQGFVQMLFGDRQNYLYWAWPRFNKSKDVDGWRAERVREHFYAAASRKGLWKSVEKVRGLGAWPGRNGELILHCGEALFIDGELHPTGEIDGHFYPRRPTTFFPSAEEVDDENNPAHDVMAALRTWNWGRPDVDPVLILGWIGVALLAGALPWRPSMFLVGDRGTGKSSLQAVLKAIFGSAIVSTPDTTPAGIYQHIGSDALPIAVDELEADGNNARVNAVVKLARLAASGGLMLRGGQDHQGIEFQARSTFLFSAINRPPLPAQDLSRLALINIGKLDPAKLKSAPTLLDADTIGPRLLRRMADAWDDFEKLYEEYRTALRSGGHDSRGQDTYGIFLTCAHMMLGDEGLERESLPFETLESWGHTLAAEKLQEVEDAQDNWQSCLQHLLTSRVDAWRNGQRQTVGALLDAMHDQVEGLTFSGCEAELAQAGLGLKAPGTIAPGYVLAVPNSGPLIASLFKGTPWGGEGHLGVWGPALRQGPPDVVVSEKGKNRARINGVQLRCTMIVLDKWNALNEV